MYTRRCLREGEGVGWSGERGRGEGVWGVTVGQNGSMRHGEQQHGKGGELEAGCLEGMKKGLSFKGLTPITRLWL